MGNDWEPVTAWLVANAFNAVINAAGLITAALIIAAEIRRKRRIRSVMWDVSRIGYKRLPDGKELQRVSITNNGSETALLTVFMMCNAELEEKPDEPLRWQFTPHTPQDITFDSVDPNDAWLLIGWIAADNRKVARLRWVPLMPDSPLQVELAEQVTLRRRFQVMSKRLRGVTTPIGPGGQLGVKVGRVEPKEKKRTELMRLVAESELKLYKK